MALNMLSVLLVRLSLLHLFFFLFFFFQFVRERDLLTLLQLMGDYFKDPLGSKRDKTSFQLPNSAATQRIRTLFWLSYWGLKSNPHKCFLGYECACVHAWWVASAVSDSETLWAVALQTLLPIGFSRQEHWSGSPPPSPGDPPGPGIEPRSPTLQADSLPSEPPEKQVVMPKTQSLCTGAKLDLRDAVLGEVGKDSFVALPGKWGHIGLMA